MSSKCIELDSRALMCKVIHSLIVAKGRRLRDELSVMYVSATKYINGESFTHGAQINPLGLDVAYTKPTWEF